MELDMTVNDLRVELLCYQLYFNENCDIENLTIPELAEFITLRDEINRKTATVGFKKAPILEVFEDIITDELRDKHRDND